MRRVLMATIVVVLMASAALAVVPLDAVTRIEVFIDGGITYEIAGAVHFEIGDKIVMDGWRLMVTGKKVRTEDGKLVIIYLTGFY